MKVVISREIHQKIMHWIDKAGRDEVSGLGTIVLENDDYIIKSAMLLKQKNSGADTELSGEDVSKALFKSQSSEGMLNWWWHSHAGMSVFWSGTDTATIHELGEHGFILSTVFNNKRECLSSFYKNSDDHYPRLFVDNIDTVIEDSISADTIKAWDKEYDDNVIVEQPVYPQYNMQGVYNKKGKKKKNKNKKKPIARVADNAFENVGFFGNDFNHHYIDDSSEWFYQSVNDYDGDDEDLYGFSDRIPELQTGYPSIAKNQLFGSDLKALIGMSEEYWWRKFYDEQSRYPISAVELDSFYIDEVLLQTGGDLCSH